MRKVSTLNVVLHEMGENWRMKEVIEYLKEHDVTVFDPGMETLEKQQKVFNEADVVIGVHGSAMLNNVYEA